MHARTIGDSDGLPNAGATRLVAAFARTPLSPERGFRWRGVPGGARILAKAATGRPAKNAGDSERMAAEDRIEIDGMLGTGMLGTCWGQRVGTCWGQRVHGGRGSH
ncbi:MAG: hypothetical protein P8L85_10310 [Rubripirellula sp.]|nr:hypothetical protein [Rubripirellula sp.]